MRQGSTLLHRTPSVSNYRSIDFFYSKFDYSSYLKIYVNYHIFVVSYFINTTSSKIT